LVFYLFSETIAILYYGDGFFSRSPPVSSERMSEEKGAEIIAITSTPDSPLARMAGSSQTSRNGSMLPEKRFCKTG
jgi:hypothetical protein